MSHLRLLCAALLCVAGLLTGCGGESSPAGDQSSAGSTASRAPSSAFTVACPQWSRPPSEPNVDRLVDLQLECLGSEGLPVAIAGKPQRPVLINIWGSWCAPCREEMPLLVEVAHRGEGTIDVLGIASLDSREAATAAALDLGMTFPSVLDPKGQVVKGLGIPGMPVTVLLGVDGLIKDVHVGPFTSTADITAAVAEHLKVTL